MKHFKEYIKWPVKQETAKQPKIKNVLLQTYLTSLLSLLLCVSMFLGTSYAWFTSEVNNTGNEIYVGTLKVGLYKENPNGQSEADKLQDLGDVDAGHKLFDGNIRWEPGFTALETIQIVNKGDLAFYYELTFTDGVLEKTSPEQPGTGESTPTGPDGNTDTGTAAQTEETAADENALTVADVAKYFDVYVFAHPQTGDNYTPPTKYADITKTDSGWTCVGTLEEILAGKATVLKGEMKDVRKAGQESAAVNDGTTDGLATATRYTIALHMKESAGSPAVLDDPENANPLENANTQETTDSQENVKTQAQTVHSIMGQKITLNVKLVAYQMVSEPDDLGGGYDAEILTASSAESLKEALDASKNAVLTSNIALLDINSRVTMDGGRLDGAGKKITYHGNKNGEHSVGVVTTTGGEISNLTIAGGSNGRALYVTQLKSDLSVSDCIFSGIYAFNLNSAQENRNQIIRFTNTDFYGWTSYANVVKHAYFTNCLFGNVLRPYAETTLTDCTFMNEGVLDVSALEVGETLTLINCTYRNKPIEKAELKATADGVVVVEGRDFLAVNNGEVVFKSNG